MYRAMNKSNKEASFGFKKVAREVKTGLVDQVFSSVASKYDLMNDIMSLGVHRLWKDRMVREVPVQDGAHILDMAGGTGDIAFRIFRKYQNLGKDLNLTISDYNQNMLDEGKVRSIDENIIGDNIRWQKENGESTSFQDDEFDLYTIAYGIRNFANLEQGVNEAARIVKKGGKFLCLEFNQVENEAFKKLYDFYSFNVIPAIGGMVTGDKESYDYFVESIRMFPKSEDFVQMLKDAGFKSAKFEKLTFGLTTLYIAER